ncbi:MAG TPA: MtrB/PioB family outer membrane beta-barrel protein [Candidatus Polarisedimenticolaceae bacterium]|nr:MtrB/PioB family outer membrane beta-barrel protein [Candidatus Polarisedimenticolaceae bacterium]
MRRTSWLAGIAVVLAAIGRSWSADTPPPAPPPPAEGTTSGDVAIGLGTADGLDDSSKAQQYREIPNGFFLDQFNFFATTHDWRFDLFATDLLQQDQRVLFSASNAKSLRIHVGYDQIPVWYSNTAATLFANGGGGTMLFPVTIRQANETANPVAGIGTNLQNSLAAAQPIDIRYRRDRAFADVTWNTPVAGLTTTAAFSQEQRNGTHDQTLATNFSVGTDVTEFAAPTDFTSRVASLGVDYAKKRFDVGGSVEWSQFTNDLSSASLGTTVYDAYIVDNPLRATDGTPTVPNPAAPNNLASSRFLLSAPPDSRQAWVNLHAGWRFADWGRASLEFAVGENKNDSDFLPFTLNSAIVPPAPFVVLKDGTTAASAYDGKIDLTRWDARVTGHPLRWFSFEAFAHDYKYDNNTPTYVLPNWVSADVGLDTDAVSEPFGYEQRTYGADATFKPNPRLSVGVGGRRESWDYTFRDADHTNEDIFDIFAAWTPGAIGDIRLSYSHGERRYDSYNLSTNDPVGTRTFDQANRDRDKFQIMASITPIDRLQLGLQLFSLEDAYPDSTFGVTSAQSDSWTLDFAVDCGKGVTVTGDYGEDRYKWNLDARYAAAAPADDWSTTPDDKTRNYSLGVLANVGAKWRLSAHAAVNDAVGKQPAFFAPGGNANGNGTPFPNTSSKLETFTADATWKLRKHLDLSFLVTYENWDEANFQRDIMQPWMGAVDGGATESVYLGARVPAYDFTWARVVMHYWF